MSWASAPVAVDTHNAPLSDKGYALGFTTQEHEVSAESLSVSGSLPSWLSGSLLRTGPAKFEVGEQQMRHWFDGLAMLHRFSIADGQVSYGSRFLHSGAYRAASEAGRIVYGEFATDPCRSLFKRVQSLFSPGGLPDNANVSVSRLGERFMAMTEAPLPVGFDPRTLETAQASPFQAPGQISTAHPHSDRSSGAMLNYAAQLGPRSSYRFFSVEPDGGEPRVVASLGVSEPAYVHSFGLTEHFFVLVEFPFVVNPARLALAGRPYIENYRWKPRLGTRFTLVERDGGRPIRGFQTDACFAFHHINSFEVGDEVLVDVCALPDSSVIGDLYLDRLRAGRPIPRSQPTRFRLGLTDRSVQREPLGDGGLELPQIDYARRNGRAYRYAWGNDVGPGGWLEQVVKLDTYTGRSIRWSQAGCYPGEPVFVARPGGELEDDGALLSVVLDADAQTSFLLILDARDLRELARAEVPQHIPFGFHGQFASELV
jgi:beta,beta-carotene 9',10'-dioxygenase